MLLGIARPGDVEKLFHSISSYTPTSGIWNAQGMTLTNVIVQGDGSGLTNLQVESQVADIRDQISGVSNQVTGVEGRVSKVESRTNLWNTAYITATDHESRISDNQSAITNLQSAMSTNYLTSGSSDTRYVNANGDSMTGGLTLHSNLVVQGDVFIKSILYVNSGGLSMGTFTEGQQP